MIIFIYGLYALFILGYIMLSFFIAYHLKKYGINSQSSNLTLLFFFIISALLLFSNLVLFFFVDWSIFLINFLPNNFNTF